MQTRLLILLYVFVNLTNGNVRKPRIIGGETGDSKLAPWSVHIFMYNSLGEAFTCGGSLISDSHILTAAHCIIGYEIYELDFGGVQQVVIVTPNFVFPHPHYNNITYEYDIGILQIPESIQLSEDVDVVGLPSFSERRRSFETWYAITSGWGRTTPKENSESNKMKWLIMQILNYNECPQKFKTKLCAEGEATETICKGDSGGPLVIYDEERGPILIGVTSIVMEHCKNDLPAFFTRVSLFLNWISYITKIEIDAYLCCI